jgi:hypothetical protein
MSATFIELQRPPIGDGIGSSLSFSPGPAKQDLFIIQTWLTKRPFNVDTVGFRAIHGGFA